MMKRKKIKQWRKRYITSCNSWQDIRVYTYAHCTATGAGHWEKYGTFAGTSERVVVPVEIRIGGYKNLLNWDANGTNIYKARDVYHQAIARDAVRI
jgi:hypothetical protein